MKYPELYACGYYVPLHKTSPIYRIIVYTVLSSSHNILDTSIILISTKSSTRLCMPLDMNIIEVYMTGPMQRYIVAIGIKFWIFH